MKKKENERNIDVFDILIILAKRKWFIIVFTALVSIFAVTYSLLATKYWKSFAAIKPVTQSNNSFSFGSSSLLGLGSSLLGGVQSEGVDLITTMKSRTFSDNVVEKFNLIQYFEVEDPDPRVRKEIARAGLLEEMMGFSLSEENGVIYISAITKDREFSAEIVDYYVEKLDNYNKNQQMTKGKQNRIFIETRLDSTETEIERIASELKTFQEENNMIELDEQVKAVVKHYSELISKKTEFEIQREFGSKYLAKNSVKIENLNAKIDVINQELQNLNLHKDGDSYILPLKDIPQMSFKYAALQLELEVQQKVYEFLYPQLESARIDELKDLPTIEIIDKPVISGMRTKPKRAKICILLFFAGLFFSSASAVFYDLMAQDQKSKFTKAISIFLGKNKL